jgi:carbon monoxide dehydrogenase subunit G
MELLADRLSIACPRETVWAIIDDPDAGALSRVLPGCETLTREPDGALRGTLAARLGFMTVRADVVARFVGREPPRSARLELEGRPRALAGTFRAAIPFSLEEAPGSRTLVSYRVELAVSGRLAAFGAPLLRDTMRRQVAVLAANLDRECASRRRGEDEPAA